MNITEIHTEIGDLFCRYKIPAITKNIPIENLHRWSDEVAAHFNLDVDDFNKKMTELFWGAAHIQLSIGYVLIARQDCKFPKGKNGKAFKNEDLPNAIGLPEIHLWYHLYNSYESIYRCWERMASVLKTVCYPGNNEKMYFGQIVEELAKDGDYNKNHYLSSLKRQIKHWNRAAKDRNEVSHGESSPFRNMKIGGKVSNILSVTGLPQIYLDYSINSPKKSIEQVVDKYEKIYPAMKVIVDFIDNIKR